MGIIWFLRRFLFSVCILLLTGTTTLTRTQHSEQTDHCDSCIKFNTTCYRSEYLFILSRDIGKNLVIHNLGLLRRDNKLFYSYEPKISDPEYYKVGFATLPNGTESGIISIRNKTLNFGTFDFDQENGIVYLGGHPGVYQLDTNEQRLVSFIPKFADIGAVFYRNGLYFVDKDVGNINYKEGISLRTLVKSKTRVKMFVIAEDGAVVYLTSEGLMATRNKELVLLSTNSFFRGLSIDLHGNVFAWWVDGIYKVILASILKESNVVKIADIPGIGCMTFDNGNNILISSKNALYRLSPTGFTNC